MSGKEDPNPSMDIVEGLLEKTKDEIKEVKVSRKFEVNYEYTSKENKKDLSKRFSSNEISTAKYNVITFLPMNLFF